MPRDGGSGSPAESSRRFCGPPGVLGGARSALLLATIAGPVVAGGNVSPPYPPSPVLFGLEWHETLNLGTDNDNWPTTWADDDHVYTAGGDGDGFGGARGNWICRIRGTPPDLTGENITRISQGDGPAGLKGSGILSIGGTLYLWARNADGAGNHARLGWSTDHGETWAWGPIVTTLGYPTFLNFGRDYAGARDPYVYTVSHDNPSAYTPSHRFILLRVPIATITNMSTYQYFVGRDGSGHPIWSYDPQQRGAVFIHVNDGQDRCLRSGLSYNAGLGRYLWWQGYPEEGGQPRLEGGFGVYDAAEPWGPWTTVYFTTSWDQPPGDCGNFCTKYTSADGGTLWLVHSAYDNFRLRRATLSRSVSARVPVPPLLGGLRAFPNPFSSVIRAELTLRLTCNVRIDVHDVRGREVITLLERRLPSGTHLACWNGRDARGVHVPSGVYWLRADVDGHVRTQRIVRLH